MKIIELTEKMRLHIGACVAGMGNFDGVHIGHQALLGKLIALGKIHKLPVVIILFEPHPREFFEEDAAPKRLSLFPDKLRLLQEYGVDGVLVMPFNQRTAALSPDIFVEQVLVQKLGVRFMVVGDDFRFGHKRSGGVAQLEKAGISVTTLAKINQDQVVLSSTRVREALAAGDFKQLMALLDHPYTITGRVIHGAKQGRRLNFPTLNIALRRRMGVSGVYLVRVHGLQEREAFWGVANVGRRPSVNPLLHPLLEVYVLDAELNAYGQRLAIEFIDKIRDEKKFDSLAALQEQIAADVQIGQERSAAWK
jgi:riboflavin kinase/FMN adenylyltransferase